VVASVNDEKITEKQFFERVQNVTAFNMGPAIEQHSGAPGRAGEFAMQNLITDAIIFQAAKAKNLTPSDDTVNKYIAFAKKYQGNPQATMVNPDPFRDDALWKDDVRRVLAYRGLILANVKMTEDELKKDYEKYRKELTAPNKLQLRVVDTRTEAKAKEAYAALQKGVAFETVALKHSEDPVSGPKSGDIGEVPEPDLERMAPAIYAVAKKLKEGEYHKGIVKQSLAMAGPTGQPTGQMVPHYYLVQLVKRTIGATPSFEDSRFLLENARFLQREPGAIQKAREEIRSLTEKAEITVNLPRYKDMPDRIKRSVQVPPPGAQPMPGGPPGPAVPAPSAPTPPAAKP
jgi:hypothetical protein